MTIPLNNYYPNQSIQYQNPLRQPITILESGPQSSTNQTSGVAIANSYQNLSSQATNFNQEQYQNVQPRQNIQPYPTGVVNQLSAMQHYAPSITGSPPVFYMVHTTARGENLQNFMGEQAQKVFQNHQVSYPAIQQSPQLPLAPNNQQKISAVPNQTLSEFHQPRASKLPEQTMAESNQKTLPEFHQPRISEFYAQEISNPHQEKISESQFIPAQQETMLQTQEKEIEKSQNVPQLEVESKVSDNKKSLDPRLKSQAIDKNVAVKSLQLDKNYLNDVINTENGNQTVQINQQNFQQKSSEPTTLEESLQKISESNTKAEAKLQQVANKKA